MKKIAALFLIFASWHANADLAVVEQIEQPRQQPETVTIKVKGDKYRKDFSNDTSAIYDLATGESIRIDHASKTYRRISIRQVEAAMESRARSTGEKPPQSPKIVDTGKTEKVDGHDAEVFTASTPAATFTYWVAKDYPDYAAINEEMKKLRAQGEGGANSFTPDSLQLDGIIVRSQSLSSGGAVTTISLVSVKTAALDDSEFQPPAGYTEVHQGPVQRIPPPAGQ